MASSRNGQKKSELAITNRSAVLLLSMALVNALALSACGTSTNPVGSYKDVVDKQDIPASQMKKAPAQNMISTDFFTITADGEMFQQSLIFREGQTLTHKLNVKMLLPNVVYELKWTNIDAGDTSKTLTRSKDDPNAWTISWAIPDQTLADNEDMRSSDIQLQLVVDPGTDPASADVLKSLNLAWDFEGLILHTQSTPTVVAVTGLDQAIQAGDNGEFTVDVKDPSSGDKTPPKLTWSKGQIDNQSVDIDGTQFIRFADTNSKPDSLGNNTWRFHLIVDTQDVKLAKTRKIVGGDGVTHVGATLQVNFETVSRSNLHSPAIVQHFTILKPDAAPTPSPTPKPSATPKPSSTPKPKPSPTPKPSHS